MKWFKHDSGANMDGKLQEVLLDYGLEGYGLYWYCLELISGKIEKDNVEFKLEHDARIIARNTGSTPQKVQDIMNRFIDLGLFELVDGDVRCFKLAKRLDQSMTSNPLMRQIINNMKESHDVTQKNHDLLPNNHDPVMTPSSKPMTQSAKPMQDQIRLDQTRIEENKTPARPKVDDGEFELVWEMYNKKGNKKTSKARFLKLSKTKKKLMIENLPKYVQSKSAITFQKDLERYISQECWNDEITTNIKPSINNIENQNYTSGKF